MFKDQIVQEIENIKHFNDLGGIFFYDRDFYYHYTDAESALSILIEGVIKPTEMKTKSELFDLKKYVCLSERNPFFSDITLTITDKGLIHHDYYVFNYSIIPDDNNLNSNFYKYEYAFGFKKKKFVTNLTKICEQFWKHYDEINLRDHDFTLIKRYFKL